MNLPQVERYEANQIFLLKDGTYILITEVQPASQSAKTAIEQFNNRRLSGKLGKRYKKGEQFKKEHIMVVEAPNESATITIDASKTANMTFTELRSKEAYYIGKISGNKAEEFKRVLSEYARSLD